MTAEEVVYVGQLQAGAWDVHPDGDRIITADLVTSEAEEEEGPAEVRDLVMLNFFEWLRERVPR